MGRRAPAQFPPAYLRDVRSRWLAPVVLAAASCEPCGPFVDETGASERANRESAPSVVADSSDSAPDSADSAQLTPFQFQRIVLITLDTTRRDHFTEARMPFLMARAAEGTVLGNHWSHSWTYPGMGSLLSGVMPIEWGESSWDRGSDDSEAPILDPEVAVIAEDLTTQGWATAYWSSNTVAATTTGLERGYGQFTAYERSQTHLIAAQLTDWLTSTASSTQFLHVHLNDAHPPYALTDPACEAEVSAIDASACPYDILADATATFTADTDLENGDYGPSDSTYATCLALVQASYACAVRAQDADLELLWEQLDAGGWLDGALVVVTSDHGEGLMDPWLNHAFNLRAPVTAGWALFWQPKLLPTGTITAPTHSLDILPSMLDLVGVTTSLPLEGVPWWLAEDDRILLNFWFGIPPGASRKTMDGGVYRNWHYIEYSTGEPELYDVSADPNEQTNLIPLGQTPPADLEAAVHAQTEVSAAFLQ